MINNDEDHTMSDATSPYESKVIQRIEGVKELLNNVPENQLKASDKIIDESYEEGMFDESQISTQSQSNLSLKILGVFISIFAHPGLWLSTQEYFLLKGFGGLWIILCLISAFHWGGVVFMLLSSALIVSICPRSMNEQLVMDNLLTLSYIFIFVSVVFDYLPYLKKKLKHVNFEPVLFTLFFSISLAFYISLEFVPPGVVFFALMSYKVIKVNKGRLVYGFLLVHFLTPYIYKTDIDTMSFAVYLDLQFVEGVKVLLGI